MVQSRTRTGDVVPLMVRVPEDLRDRIKAAAEANGRSQNSEIVIALEERYPAPKTVFSLEDIYRLADSISTAGTEAEEDARLKEVNAILEDCDNAIRFQLSRERDQYGRRQIFMTTDADR